MLDINAIRSDFPILLTKIGEKPLIYLDNAASTQKPVQVVETIREFYYSSYANVHRSPHKLGADATVKYEEARRKVASFIGASDPAELILTKGTTESINILAGIFSHQLLKPGDVILLTPSEHHSNLIPWQMAAARMDVELQFINLHDDGYFDLEEIAENWNPNTKVFAFQHASNVLGTIHPVKELCAIARERGALTVIDGAQSAPHMPVNVQETGCDFFALSGHKMCAPTGIGGLWGRRELLEKFDPIFGGGEMIRKVWLESAEYNEIPYKFEPGTPNIVGTVGWGAAIDYLEGIGMDEIQKCVDELGAYAFDQVSRIEGLRVFGPPRNRTGAVSFVMNSAHPHDIASILDSEGIAIRAGHHCAEPLMQWLDVPATARASFYFYNTRSEVDSLVNALELVLQVFGNVNQ